MRFRLFVYFVLFCVCVVLLVQNINYSLTTFAFVLLFYSYSGQIAPINVITLNNNNNDFITVSSKNLAEGIPHC